MVSWFLEGHKHSFQTRPDLRLEFRVLTGLPGSIFFFKNQNDVVLVKKNTKINRLQPGFWSGQPGQPGRRVTPGFVFFYFFLIRLDSSFGLNRRARPETEVYNFLECSKHYHHRHTANYDFFSTNALLIMLEKWETQIMLKCDRQLWWQVIRQTLS